MTDDELATSIQAAKRELGIGETETDPSQLKLAGLAIRALNLLTTIV
jgi:hypothetical protein